MSNLNQFEYISNLKRVMTEQNCDADFIDKCCSYSRNLLEQNLPVVFDEIHLKDILRLYKIQEQNYHCFNITAHGKVRLISAPSRPIKVRQRWIVDEILSKLNMSSFAHGFVKNRSIKTNAMQHIGNEYVLCVDIKDFFSSISEEKVQKLFEEIGYTHSAAMKLASLCCFNGVLPQGAPTSPYLANIICYNMDAQLADVAQKQHITYSRYADDLTFSSNQSMDGLLVEIQKIIQKYGFCLNKEKTHFFRPGQPKIITGLVVQNGKIRIPKRFKRNLKQEIYYCQKFGVLVHLENTKSTRYINYREYLYGKAYYIQMIEPQMAARYLDELDKIDWPN